MMGAQLNSWLMFSHVERHFADTEIVSRLPGGEVHRYTYADFAVRTQQLMHALDSLGMDRGATVATLAWNGFRHLECYFAVPCTGRILHTINARLSPDDIAYIIGHARDHAIFVDADLVPVLEQVAATKGLSEVRTVVVMGGPAPDGSSALKGAISYEDLIADRPGHYARLDISESEPQGLCYTSGTTGRPRGVRYTHRSSYLHALAVSSVAGMSIGPGDSVLPVVPMFHANAWGMCHAATMVGAKQVFYGGSLQPGPLVDLMDRERVTVSAGVPTVWLEAANEIARRPGVLSGIRHIVCGGSQPPRALIEQYQEQFGIPMLQAWGMTETSPLGSVAWPKEITRDWDDATLMARVSTQAGLPLPGVEITIRDEEGNDVPWDAQAVGNLLVRGPWVTDEYLGGEEPDRFTDDGWFVTGDVAVGSPDGYFVIVDRTKDLIKSGGEWISSIAMEAAIMALPEVDEAAVVAVPDPKWQERPLACVVLRPGTQLSREQLAAHLQSSGFSSWQVPDRIEVVAEIPRTSVGKFDKKVLRARFAGPEPSPEQSSATATSDATDGPA